MTDFYHLPHEEQLRRLLVLAQAATSRYALPAGVTVTMINLSENATYKIEDRRRPEMGAPRPSRGLSSKTAIASELAWAMALRREAGVLTPVPVLGRDGELIQMVPHDLLPRPRNVVLFEWEAGSEPSENDVARPSRSSARRRRACIGTSRNWRSHRSSSVFTWDFETSLGAKPHWGRWQGRHGPRRPRSRPLFQPRRRPRSRSGLRRYRQGTGALRPHPLRHAARQSPDRRRTVKAIDFDDCGFSWLMYDCATTVSFFEHKPEVPELLAAWVRGYRRVTPLSVEDEAEIPTFVMLRRLLLLAWIGSHSETELAQSMGVVYTQDTVPLCEAYLARFSEL